METLNLIDAFAEFAKQKNIDRPTMIRILEDVFRTMIRKKFERFSEPKTTKNNIKSLIFEEIY